ncbi:MAG: hypothetical protein JWR50_2041 [Mucilaginibacter sp.]|nr:hypothetical protein [Mucilaginibacter sp.]
MDIISVILLLVIIIIMINNKNVLHGKIDLLEFRLSELQRQLKQNSDNRPITVNESKPVEKPQPKEPIITERVETIIEPPKESVNEVLSSIRKPVKRHEPEVHINEEPRLSFFERYPDLEKFIGENLANKLGIGILVLAIGFFVKYAIDNNWIGPIGRVGIGVLCGGILIGIAHKLRNTYKSFSSVLVGGGLAILYFTITLAYHQFHLFNQTASFIIMVVITCFAVVLSFLYDKQELAVIALIGGLASPFMVSSGNANYNALFIYLVILNAGLLVIAYYKSWRILNISAFVLTVLIVGGVIYTLTSSTYATGFLYISILYLMFFAINVANNVRENKKFISVDFSILLINTALYFSVGLYLLTAMHHEQFRGLFSAGLGAVNLVLSFLLFRNKKVDINILYLLIGITLTFLSLTAPIQLNGHNITLFWAAESVLLYWLYLKSEIPLMKLTSLIIWIAMLLSLLIDWMDIYAISNNPLSIIANKGFITTLTTAVSSYLLYLQAAKDSSKEIYKFKINASIFQYAALILLFLSGLFEINHQFANRYPGTSLNSIYVMLYVPAFVYILYSVAKRITTVSINWQTQALIITAYIVVHLLFTPEFYIAQNETLVLHSIMPLQFITHWAGAVFIGLLFYELVLLVKTNLTDTFQTTASWLLSLGIVIFLSIEVSLASNQLFYSATSTISHIEEVYVKVGLPILWGLTSFALMWLGMRNKERSMRIISLTLFLITLIKLFVFDIRNIPPAGKIAAFFCLGVLLLIISFMYQKVKKIIVEDEGAQTGK